MPPRVHFLFLAVDKVSNLGVWLNFFARAPKDQYRALVHCKLEECEKSLQGTILETVPAVSSWYCTDLVSPMNQLLLHALQKDPFGSPADKFAFVSDSSLPAKPFAQIYNDLVSRQGSDFCIFPAAEWAEIQDGGTVEVAPKHHQWIILDRKHARDSCERWAAGRQRDFMHRFRMNQGGQNFGCLDEFWHMAAIYGPITQATTQSQDVHLPNFVGGPLHVATTTGWQGQCDTFVIWAKYLYSAPVGSGRNPFRDLHSSLDGASVPHAGNSQRPGWWDTISRYGLQAIRNSEFLFVRKFIDNPRLADGGNFAQAYAEVVLQ